MFDLYIKYLTTMRHFLFILFLLFILFICYCVSDNKLREELEREKDLLKQDQLTRNTKLLIKSRRARFKSFSTKAIICIIAFMPFYDLQGWPQRVLDQIKNISFTFAVLFFRSTDHLQVIMDNADEWLSKLFHGKVDEELKQIEITIENRKSKIQKIEYKLAKLQA